MIVVEGCDGCGKSTLVDHLRRKFELVVGIRGTSNRDELYKVTRQDTYAALANAVMGYRPPEIWDRLFVSEFVYHDVVGRQCEFNDREREFVLDVMNALTFPMIICLPPYGTVVDNCLKVHQMKGVNDNLRTLYDRYQTGQLPWPENTIWYDYTGLTPDFANLQEVESEVKGYLEDRKARESWN